MPDRTRHVVAFYEIDRRHGGPEEGGWWYDCGELRRVLRVAASEDAAHATAARANRLLDRLQRGKPGTSSLIYDGGRHAAHVFAHTAPRLFPRPGRATSDVVPQKPPTPASREESICLSSQARSLIGP